LFDGILISIISKLDSIDFQLEHLISYYLFWPLKRKEKHHF